MTKLDLGVFVVTYGCIYEGDTVLSVHATKNRAMVAVMNRIREEKETADRCDWEVKITRAEETERSDRWLIAHKFEHNEDFGPAIDHITVTWHPLN